MSQPLSLSIVTPSYNTARYLGAAIGSVLDQQWPALDYIVMDGGSTDGSVDLLRGFGPRLRWVSEKDGGQSNAINRGFALTQGEILGWLNSDDTYAPGAFAAIAQFFADHPEVDLVYGDADYLTPAGEFLAHCVHIEPFSRRRLFRYSDFIVQPAAFFRRSAFDAVGGIDESIHWAMDYDLWLRMAAGGATFAYLPRRLANFRWLKDNKTATGRYGRLDEIDRILAKHGLGSPAYNRLERVNLLVGDAAAAVRQGALGKALACAGQATGALLRSPRAVVSMFQPLTWKIIYTGQVLRGRSMRAEARAQAAQETSTLVRPAP